MSETEPSKYYDLTSIPYWGVATSAAQVEDVKHRDDWAIDEPERVQELIARDWSTVTGGQGRPINVELFGDRLQKPETFLRSDLAEHWTRYPEHLRLFREELGATAYRFSLNWSVLQPQPGEWNEEAIKHYQDMVKECRANNLEPFVTLWHKALPQWFFEKGGWETASNTHYFTDFVERMTAELPDVRFWMTMNEPELYVYDSYFTGQHPPYKKSLLRTLRVRRNLAQAHHAAHQKIKDNDPEAQVGIAHSKVYFFAGDNSLVSKLASRVLDETWNNYFSKHAKGKEDFIGIQYYFPCAIKGFQLFQNAIPPKSDFAGHTALLNHIQSQGGLLPDDPHFELTNDMGEAIFPEGVFVHATREWRKRRIPILVSEYGISDARDKFRPAFTERHARALGAAMAGGVQVLGNLAWTAFGTEGGRGTWEWGDKGRLVDTGYFNADETPRESARVLQSIISTRKVPME